MHYQPAAQIIEALGGLTEVSKAAKTTVTTVQRWRLSPKQGGTGGFIPRKYHERLIRHAKKKKLVLSAADFIEVTSLRTEGAAA